MLSIIVAVARNMAIGRDNKLLWHLSDDLKYFKSVTQGHPVIVGRNTFISLGKPLPGRQNIVVLGEFFDEYYKDLGDTFSVSPSGGKIFDNEGIIYCQTLEDALKMGESISEEAFIIGGGSIYRATMDIADKLYITEVDVVIEDADTFFPEIDNETWRVESKGKTLRDEKAGLEYRFVTYLRK